MNYCIFVSVSTGKAVVIKYNGPDYLDYEGNEDWKLYKSGPKKALQDEADEINNLVLND